MFHQQQQQKNTEINTKSRRNDLITCDPSILFIFSFCRKSHGKMAIKMKSN